MEGPIAKQLADLSSRKLLPTMMAAFREHLEEQKIDLMKLEPNPRAPKILIMLYTRISKEIIPMVASEESSRMLVVSIRPNSLGRNVYLVVDLIGVVIEAWWNIGRLSV